jgi:hypothetical protein
MAVNFLAKSGENIGTILNAIDQARVDLPPDVARRDVIEVARQAYNRTRLAHLAPDQPIPISLMTEGVLKANRRYYAIFKAQVRFRKTGFEMTRYISGYFDEMKTTAEWLEDLRASMFDPKYGIDYDILSAELDTVKHQIDAAY